MIIKEQVVNATKSLGSGIIIIIIGAFTSPSAPCTVAFHAHLALKTARLIRYKVKQYKTKTIFECHSKRNTTF